jgi:hypothetical protein
VRLSARCPAAKCASAEVRSADIDFTHATAVRTDLSVAAFVSFLVLLAEG